MKSLNLINGLLIIILMSFHLTDMLMPLNTITLYQ
nr:MAG TPA: hypothetical protein [Caudoviricetes sp.]